MENSIWYPPSGGIPALEKHFAGFGKHLDERIEKYCSAPGTFEVGLSTFGDAASNGVINGLSSEDGAYGIAQVVRTGRISEAFSGKGGLIAFFVLSLIFLVCTLIFSALVNKKCRSCVSSNCGGVCKDRQRVSPEDLSDNRPSCSKGCAGVSILVLFMCAIATFVYCAQLGKGKDSLHCDFWSTMKAHYYGTGGMHLSPNVVTDWKGSQIQSKNMKDLSTQVNPKPDGEDGNEICPMCVDIYERFDGGDGLSTVLNASRHMVMQESFKGVYVIKTVSALINLLRKEQGFDKIAGMPKAQSLATNLQMQTAGLVEGLVTVYARDLNTTTDEGIALFEENLANYLGRDSTMLQSSYMTAMSGLYSILDVDITLAKIMIMWDVAIEPKLTPALTAVLAIACIMGIFAILLSFTGCFLVGKAKDSSKLPSLSLVKCLGVTFVLLMVFSGICMVLGALFFMVGSIAKDGCSFVDRVAYEDGNWQIFPPLLWNYTGTNQTNLPTVFDSCIKETGDGDVSSALGITMLLSKLNQGVAKSESNLLATVEKRLDLTFKDEKTKSLVDNVRSVTKQVFMDRPDVAIVEGAEKAGLRSFDGYSYVKPNISNEFATHLSLMNFLPEIKAATEMTGVASIVLALANPVQRIATNLFQKSVGINMAVDKYKIEIERLDPSGDNIKQRTICTRALEYLFKTGCTKGDSVLYIDGANRDPATGLLKEDIFGTPEGVALLDFLKKDGFGPDHNYEKMVSLIFQIQAAETFLYTPLLKKYFDAKAAKHDLFPDPRVLKEFSNLESVDELTNRVFVKGMLNMNHCVDVVDDPADVDVNAATGRVCRFHDLMAALEEYTEGLAEVLLNGFNTANSRIMSFVKDDTIGAFNAQLKTADSNLKDFDCQFVGTAMRAGVKEGLCNVIMPSVASLGLLAIFISLFSLLGAVVSWRVYHYYKDIEHVGSKVGAVEEVGESVGLRAPGNA